jgi:hypothetical protein
MAKFYFGKFKITVFFVIFLLVSIFNIGIAIITVVNRSLELSVLFLSVVPILGLLSYWRYLKAVYNNSPALIIDQDSIYIFDIDQIIFWKDIELYKPGRYIDGRILSINFKLADPKVFLSLINKTAFRYIYHLLYFLFKKITIKVMMSLLEDSPESILKAIAAVTNTSQIIQHQN